MLGLVIAAFSNGAPAIGSELTGVPDYNIRIARTDL